MVRKFSSSKEKLDIDRQYFKYDHHINFESVVSVKSQDCEASVITNFKDEEKSIDVYFKYKLKFHESKWFLIEMLLMNR